MKSPEAFERGPKILTHDELRVRNEIQLRFISESIGQGEDLEKHAEDWINKYGTSFADLFDDNIEINTDLVKEWDEDPDRLFSQFKRLFPEADQKRKAA